jgi:hypothetical protein
VSALSPDASAEPAMITRDYHPEISGENVAREGTARKDLVFDWASGGCSQLQIKRPDALFRRKMWSFV